jgi:glycogen debranching enzyme
LEELIRHKDQYYILATSTLVADRTRVLKQGETFAVLDRSGDIRAVGLGEQGVYHEGTRYVSSCSLRIGGAKPLLLGSSVRRENPVLTVDLTNPDFTGEGRGRIPHGWLHLVRSIFVWDAACYQMLRVRNYGHGAVRVPLELSIETDFADIFEVRGTRRARRGRCRAPVHGAHHWSIDYEGLDGVLRRLRVECAPQPAAMTSDELRFDLSLEPNEEETIYFVAHCSSRPRREARDVVPIVAVDAPSLEHDEALRRAERAHHALRDRFCEIHTSNERFNEWLHRSQSDLLMMVTETDEGFYPDAGVPWFSTRFGRDGIITALETLWVNPDLAAGVLRYLAAHQASEVDPERDAEPGKILHETRKGEMAALHEIPFDRYYGSVDATPLFVMLAAAHHDRTGDLEFAEELWPSVERALEWLERFGDLDGDGFVEYDRRSPKGLVQQGWKDSGDSVFHADGTPAEGPIALCEVQAYAYGARVGAARLLRALGREEPARKLEQQAEALRAQFELAFWCEDLATYSLALDGHKRPCRVRTSNAGHALFTGIARGDHARRVGETLLDPASFSGWGVRTVAAGETAFNPMSYHNGSVWPHDNALVASGLARYGQRHAMMCILAGLFEATTFVELSRLPELFCGFARRAGEGPTLYPVACSPQSWAAASVYSLLESALGMRVVAAQSQIQFHHPRLPAFLKEVEIRDLHLGDSAVDLSLRRDAEGGVAFRVRKRGAVDVVTTK